MTATTANTVQLDKERVDAAVQEILTVLGQPTTEAQSHALTAFHNGDSALIKRLSVGNLSDNYLKCLGYLVSAPKLTPNTDTILAEAARSAAAWTQDRALSHLSDAIARALR